MLFYWLLFALIFGYPRQESPKPEEQAVVRQQASLLYERHRQAAIRMNELAAHINSEADARAFVDAVADMFADNLPPAWATRGIRERIARAEYEAVSNPLRQIPEQRIADVWNKYVREIGASEETLVTTAEIHSMRDASIPTRSRRVLKLRRQTRKPQLGLKYTSIPPRFGLPNTSTCASMTRITSSN